MSRDRDLEPKELIWKDWKVDLKARQHSTPTLKREVCSNATVPQQLMLASECQLWYSAFPMKAANFGVSRFQPSGADGCSAVGAGCVITVFYTRTPAVTFDGLPPSELTGCPAPSKRFIRLVIQKPISSFSTVTPAVALPAYIHKKYVLPAGTIVMGHGRVHREPPTGRRMAGRLGLGAPVPVEAWTVQQGRRLTVRKSGVSSPRPSIRSGTIHPSTHPSHPSLRQISWCPDKR